MKMRPDRRKRTSSKACRKYIPVLKSLQEDSQNYLVLKHIIEHGAITPKEAERAPIFSMRLSARVWDLKHKHGVPIKTQTMITRRNGKVKTHASYYIMEEEENV